MSLKVRIQEDMKTAMRSGDKDRLGCIRLIVAAVQQREVDERITLDDTQLLGVLEKMGKQRRESIAQFQAGGRADLVAKENAELAIINAYMPAPLAADELDALINEAIAQAGGEADDKNAGVGRPERVYRGIEPFRLALAPGLAKGDEAGATRTIAAGHSARARHCDYSSSNSSSTSTRCAVGLRWRNCGVWRGSRGSRTSRGSRIGRSEGSRPILLCSSMMSTN